MRDHSEEMELPSSIRIVARPDDYLWMAWEGENCYALFDRATGLTHLINAFPAAILTTLADRRVAFTQLADELADLCGAVADASWDQTMAASVNGLVALGVLDVDPEC
jgi:hypothetical protein